MRYNNHNANAINLKSTQGSRCYIVIYFGMHTNLIYPLILNTLWGIKKWQKKRKSWVTDQQKERTQGISSREKTRKAKEITRLVGHCCLCYCCCSAVVAAGWECVVIYDNFIVLSARCPFYFRLCFAYALHTHTHTYSDTQKLCKNWRRLLLCSILLCARRYQTFSALLRILIPYRAGPETG